MKRRLVAGTINHYPAEEGWENTHVDISERDIWHPELGAVHVDHVADLADGLSFLDDATFDEVRCHHVLEHMTHNRGLLAIEAMYRVLKSGGVLDIEVPDMDRICEAWVEEAYPREDLQQWIYGETLPHYESADNHRFGWWEDGLRVALEEAGFVVGGREQTGLALRFRAGKP